MAYARQPKLPARLFWLSLCLTLFDTGLRFGATLGLKVEDVDLETGRLTVRPELQKTRVGQSFQLTPQTLPLVCASARLFERDLLFPRAKHRTHIFHHFKKLLKKAGLPNGRWSKFHRIKKTSASMIEAANGDGAATK